MKLSDILTESIILESITFWIPDESKYGMGKCPFCDDGIDGYHSKVGNYYSGKKPTSYKEIADSRIRWDELLKRLKARLEFQTEFKNANKGQPEDFQTRVDDSINKITKAIELRTSRHEAVAKRIFDGGFDAGPCQACDGTQEYEQQLSTAPELNVANTNARVVLDILGLEFDYSGSIPAKDIPTLRRRLIQFSNSKGSADAYTRDYEKSQSTTMRKSKDADGITRLEPKKGATMIDMGLSKEQIRGYVDRLMPLLDYAQKKDVDITWG